MVIWPPSERFFHTTWDKIVYFRTFLLSIIPGTEICQLLAVTFPFKKISLHTTIIKPIVSQRIRKWGQRKATLPVTDSEFMATDGIVAKIFVFEPYVYHLWPLLLKEIIFPVTFLLKELVIYYSNQKVHKIHKICGSKLKHLKVITA